MGTLCALALSGGLDSAVLCAWLLERHGAGSVRPVFFQYGSKHNDWEEKAARAISAHYGLALVSVDLSPAFRGIKSALLAADERPIPTAAYDADSMAATAVPGRNLIFASVLASFAESEGMSHIALATHGGDHHLYADCRPAFTAALAATVRESSNGSLGVLVPFENMDKTRIVAEGLRLGVPFSLTRSCYAAGEFACGRCGTCLERLEAFEGNSTKDPAGYVGSAVE